MAGILIFLLMFFSYANCQDLGSFGTCYEIAEKDFAEVIREKSASKKQDFLKETAFRKYVKMLEGSKGFEKAERSLVRYKDPSIVSKQEIRDDKGKIIVRKGDRFNPLDLVSLKETLLFFDGTDEEQCQWARNFQAPNKWILVKGNPFDLEEKEGRPVYYDQSNVLSSHFEIQRIPATVSQEENLLKIEEIAL